MIAPRGPPQKVFEKLRKRFRIFLQEVTKLCVTCDRTHLNVLE